MVFSSLIFLFGFIPIFFTCYFLTPEKWRNYTAVVGSLVFYAWGAPRFVFVLLMASLVDYMLARLIHQLPADSTPAKKRRQLLLTLSIVSNLSLLFYFKYANFFVDQTQQLLAAFGFSPIHWIPIALPIGISFFTFHKLSYTVDVYRGTVEPAKDFATFALYILLFPQLIAGPIIRYHDIAAQFVARTHSAHSAFEGVFRFSIGLGKKILIADPLAGVADRLFSAELNTLPTPFIWFGVICYAYQIYFDFSGYSDMAIGLGKIMGFRFPENFNQPYSALNITDFWHRWHMTLSAWMKEYLYIPLGGNRHGVLRTYANLWIVFLLSGLWHGASWTFICWGAFHGLFLVLDKLFWLNISRQLPRLVNLSLTFIIVLVGWVLFRADSLPQAAAIIERMFLPNLAPANEATRLVALEAFASGRAQFMFIVATLICFAPPYLAALAAAGGRFAACDSSRYPFRQVLSERLVVGTQFSAIIILLILASMSIANANFIPFIYFRF